MTDRKPGILPPLALRVRVPPDVLMRQVGDELVLLNMDRESYYGLNPSGALLMQFAAAGATIGEIVERMLGEFEVERGQLEIDVRAVAAELMAAGLLEEGIPG